jgi:putative membrane protein
MPAYDAFSDDELTLRDQLALDRTTLANERTFLAYARTAIGLLAGGVALLQLADAAWAVGLGWAALVLSPFVMLLGIRRFWKVRGRLRRVTSSS